MSTTAVSTTTTAWDACPSWCADHHTVTDLYETGDALPEHRAKFTAEGFDRAPVQVDEVVTSDGVQSRLISTWFNGREDDLSVADARALGHALLKAADLLESIGGVIA